MPPNSHVLGDHLSLFNECIVLTVSDSLQRHGLWPARLLCPWEFSRQEYFSGLPFHLPGELPDPGTEPASPVSLTLAGDSLLLEPPGNQKEMKIGYRKDICIPAFIATLFTIAKIWIQPKRPSVDEWIKKMQHIQYTAM